MTKKQQYYLARSANDLEDYVKKSRSVSWAIFWQIIILALIILAILAVVGFAIFGMYCLAVFY